MRIGLLDHMGYGNLGDAATQDVLIANIRARVPGTEIIGFSLNPDDTRKRHNIPCYSITHWHPGLNKSGQASSNGTPPRSGLKRVLKTIPVFSPIVLSARNLARELMHLWQCFTVVRSLDSLIIAGGGQLCELWRGPWSHPYNVFKFSALTKLANRKLLFVNVGAGPLNSILSKAFIRASLCLADYVSLRDVQSQALVHRLGVTRQTHVYPDSVYALDIADYERGETARTAGPLVGLNPIGFCDPRIWPRKDAAAYSRYLDNLAAFSLWLISCNYRLRLFSAELSVDGYALEDLKARLLSSLSPADIAELFAPPNESVSDLVAEMSQCDFIVTSKFHGVVFSHLLAKPVIALSYHPKIDDLMRTVGHSQHCLDIESFDYENLENIFTTLAEDVQGLTRKFRKKTESYSKVLKAQFDEIFVPDNLRNHPQTREINGTVLSGSA
jgi:polysaccharide pyruvyl transferase WcaK-like protein